MITERIRAGFVQTRPHFGEVSSNLARVEEVARELSAFDLLVLPELFSSGYLFRDRREALSLAEGIDGPTVAALHRIAAERGGAVVGGFAERDGDRVYNAAALATPGRDVFVYRKVHLFDRETGIFDAGDGPFPVWTVETASGRFRVGVMICFDWFFPESARCLALEGAEIIAHPSNLVLPHCQEAMRTRCLENRVFAVTSNRTAFDDRGDGLRLEFTGESQVVDPRGRVLTRAGAQGEHVVIEEIDLALARDKRITERNELLRDRRPDAYAGLVDPGRSRR